MPPVTLEQARAAKKTIVSLLEDTPHVVGIGITRIRESYGVKVNVSVPDVEVPEQIDGVPIEVEVVGVIRPR
jgi:hypothetical protein